MITDKSAVEELVFRFKILERYPKTTAGEDALIEALQNADSVIQAQQFVAGWIRSAKKCPMPCDVYQSLDTPGRTISTFRSYPLPVPGETIPPPDYKCNLCQDTGWFMVPLRKEIPGLPGQRYMGAKRCAHPADSKGTRSF